MKCCPSDASVKIVVFNVSIPKASSSKRADCSDHNGPVSTMPINREPHDVLIAEDAMDDLSGNPRTGASRFAAAPRRPAAQ